MLIGEIKHNQWLVNIMGSNVCKSDYEKISVSPASKPQRHSLLALIQLFQQIPAGSCSSVCKRLIILDGLDGSRLSGLQQRSGGVRCHQEVLGQCSSAMPHLGTAASPQPWIASRLAAANQIPPLCVSRVTEAQGFTDSKNEEYFKRIFNDEVQQNHLLHSRASLICVSSCSVG